MLVLHPKHPGEGTWLWLWSCGGHAGSTSWTPWWGYLTLALVLWWPCWFYILNTLVRVLDFGFGPVMVMLVLHPEQPGEGTWLWLWSPGGYAGSTSWTPWWGYLTLALVLWWSCWFYILQISLISHHCKFNLSHSLWGVVINDETDYIRLFEIASEETFMFSLGKPQKISFLKGIVKLEFFFHKKVGNCTLMNAQKKIWLGTFFGSVLTIFISFSGSVIVYSGLVIDTVDSYMYVVAVS